MMSCGKFGENIGGEKCSYHKMCIIRVGILSFLEYKFKLNDTGQKPLLNLATSFIFVARFL